MSNYGTQLGHQIVAELRLLRYSRIWIMGLPLILCALATYVGSRTAVRARLTEFEERSRQYEDRGFSLDEVLAAPTSVTTHADGSETIDNPLKHDFIELSHLVAATEPVHMMTTALDLTTFLVIPLAFLYLGAWMANIDRTTRAIDWRAARQSWASVACAKFLAIAIVAVLAVALTSVAGLVIGGVGEMILGGAGDEIPIPAILDSPRPLTVKLAVSALFAVVWGLVGYLVGHVTRSFSWPIVLAALFLFMVPFLGKWDPRNAQTVIGHHTFDFWGQFKLRPAIHMSGTELALGVGLVAVVVGAGLVWAAQRPRMR